MQQEMFASRSRVRRFVVALAAFMLGAHASYVISESGEKQVGQTDSAGRSTPQSAPAPDISLEAAPAEFASPPRAWNVPPGYESTLDDDVPVLIDAESGRSRRDYDRSWR